MNIPPPPPCVPGQRMRPDPHFLLRRGYQPPGYVAGVGRGAIGFVTRPDHEGDTAAPTGDSLVPIKGVDITGTGRRTTGADSGGAWLQRHAALNERVKSQFDAKQEDEEEVQEEGMLGKASAWDREDEEADAVYARIEDAMATRRKRRGTSGDAGDEDVFREERQALRGVSAEQWAAIPDVVAVKRAAVGSREPGRERYTPVPDSLLLPTSSTVIDLAAISEAKERVLVGRLDAVAKPDETRGCEDVAPAVNLEDLEKQRQTLHGILASATEESRVHVLCSLARIEVALGARRKAETLLREALSVDSSNEAAWLGLAECIDGALVEATVRRALKACPASVPLWVRAIERARPVERVRSIKLALQQCPASTLLWEKLLAEEGEDSAEVLQLATEHCPGEESLLYRYVTHPEAARADVLPPLWRAFFHEHRHGDAPVLEGAFTEADAVTAARWSFPRTGQRIVDSLPSIGADCAAALRPWVQMRRLREHPHDVDAWLAAGKRDRDLLRQALEHNPGDARLWLQLARLDPALLPDAVAACPDNARIRFVHDFHRMKCTEEGPPEGPNPAKEASKLVDPAKEASELVDPAKEASKLVGPIREASELASPVLRARWKFLRGLPVDVSEDALLATHRDASLYEAALRLEPTNDILYLKYAQSVSSAGRARSILERGRLAAKYTSFLWEASIVFEQLGGNSVDALVARGFQLGVPSVVRYKFLRGTPERAQRAALIQALNNSARGGSSSRSEVLMAIHYCVAVVMWREGSAEKARRYRADNCGPKQGGSAVFQRELLRAWYRETGEEGSIEEGDEEEWAEWVRGRHWPEMLDIEWTSDRACIAWWLRRPQ